LADGLQRKKRFIHFSSFRAGIAPASEAPLRHCVRLGLVTANWAFDKLYSS
jgi:hypothetical protein